MRVPTFVLRFSVVRDWLWFAVTGACPRLVSYVAFNW